ncbi:MAG: SRPBCC domain-containing protein [Bacteroidia bacterium]|nr:SRPBCC domain-containing protein [Bacteroidia bacterium]
MMFNERTIYKKLVLKVSANEIWDCWTTETGLRSFFCPDCSVELKIGGKYEIYFISENEYGHKGSEGCKVLSFVPERMFSFSWNAPPSIPTVRNHSHKAWVVVLINNIGNKTEVELFHLGFLKGSDWDETVDYFENAWDIVMQNLKQKFNNE